MPGNRRHIPDDVKMLVVQLSETRPDLSQEDIREMTGVAPSTQSRICALYKRTGKVSVKPEVCGRPTKLKEGDMAVGVSVHNFIYSFFPYYLRASTHGNESFF